MSIFRSFRSAAFTGGLAALFLLPGCGGSSTSAPATPPAGSGRVNLTITDAPSDTWQQVSVVLQSASLRTQGTQTWTQVWTAPAGNPAAGTVNLVDLSSVAELLGTPTVDPGTYDALQLTINTDPSTMTLVDDDGNTIPADDITVVDPSGKGQINVTIAPALQVVQGSTASLQADFDLAHPLSIVQETIGGVEKVVLNLQVRYKALPERLQDLQFARKLGTVTAETAATDSAPATFTLTDQRNATFTYQVDANTLYLDADAKAAGSFAGLLVGDFALVASNLNADGTLYARRVWYATTAAPLPVWTPEGLVRRVYPADNTFKILNKAVGPSATARAWALQTVLVDANTVWTFHNTVAMGTGTGFLQDIWRGTRVDVQLDSTGTTATSVNVDNAHDEGFITQATATGLTFGWPMMAPLPSTAGICFGPGDFGARTWNYDQTAPDTFNWWYYALPSSASTVVQDLTDTIAAAQSENLPASGYASLAWDTVSQGWEVSQLVLDPERLNLSVITAPGYTDSATAGEGTLPVSFFSPTPTAPLFAPMTLTLDYAGDLQTVVEAITWSASARTLTFQVPVPHSDWATLLQPPATGSESGARIWVRPVKNGTGFDWHAYNVEVFTLAQ